MKRTIWKFPIDIRPGRRYLTVPVGAQPLSVQLQDDEPMLWLLVDPEARTVQHAYYIAPTGREFNADGWLFVGTLQTPPFVWHLFWGEGV